MMIMKVKVNVHVSAESIYRVLLKELQKDIKQQVKTAKRPTHLTKGYTYTQKIKFHEREYRIPVTIEDLQENVYYQVKSQYPKYTQTISYRLQALDENYTCIIYQEKLSDIHLCIKFISFLKGHLSRMKIMQYLHHLEAKAKQLNEINRESRSRKSFMEI